MASSLLTRSQSVTDLLRDHVLNGGLPPGAHLQEVRLSEMFGVSRTPIRSALNTLASEGLLEYSPNRGYRVRAFPAEVLLDAFDARSVLEGLACRRAAERGLSKEDEETLVAALAEGDRILKAGRLRGRDLEAYRKMNVRVHETIIHGSGNRWIGEFARLTQKTPLTSDRIIFWDDYDSTRRSHDDHHRIVDAILRREASRAEHLMHEHIYYVKVLLKAHLDSQPDQPISGNAFLHLPVEAFQPRSDRLIEKK